MRILLLADVNNVHTQRWVSALAKKNIEIILFSFSKNNSDFYRDIKNVSIISSHTTSKGTLFAKIGYLKNIFFLRKVISSYKPDIVHAHYASSYGLLGAITKTKIPYIISVWGSDVYEFPKKIIGGKNILKFNFRKADYIFSTSNVMAIETKKYTSKDIEITPFGVNTDLFSPNRKSSEIDFLIGNVKTLKPIYGIDTLIRATQLIIRNNPEKKIKLEIYGTGPQKEELIKLAKSLEINDNIIFGGFIKNEELPKIYNKFDVAVFLSNSESFGVVAVEAMSCGCPVVASDAEGFTEVIDNNVSGFIVPKRNPEATAKAIQKLIDNPSLRNSMGKAGRERVTKLYNWEENVELMFEKYQSILRNNN